MKKTSAKTDSHDENVFPEKAIDKHSARPPEQRALLMSACTSGRKCLGAAETCASRIWTLMPDDLSGQDDDGGAGFSRKAPVLRLPTTFVTHG